MIGDREKFLLFRIYRHKDQKAFDELYELYVPRIRRYLAFKLPTPADADEMTSEVFVRAWEYMQDAHVEHAGGLLYRIAKTTCANFYRTRSRRPSEVALEAAAEISDRGEEQMVQEVSTILSIETIEQLLPKLKDDYRDVIIMRYLDEMSVREVAEAMEKTEASVRMLIHRALQLMRENIDQTSYDQQP